MTMIALFAVHLGVKRSISGTDTKGQAEGLFNHQFKLSVLP